MDPSATVGWGHPAQAQLAAQLAAGTQGSTGQLGGGTQETCSEKSGALSVSPKAEKVQLLQGGTGCKDSSQELQDNVIQVRNCQVKATCFKL